MRIWFNQDVTVVKNTNVPYWTNVQPLMCYTMQQQGYKPIWESQKSRFIYIKQRIRCKVTSMSEFRIILLPIYPYIPSNTELTNLAFCKAQLEVERST